MGLTPPERPSSTTCVAYMYVGGRMGFIGNAIALARGTIAAMDITATIDHIVVITMIEKVTAIAVGSVIAASSYARCQRTSAPRAILLTLPRLARQPQASEHALPNGAASGMPISAMRYDG